MIAFFSVSDLGATAISCRIAISYPTVFLYLNIEIHPFSTLDYLNGCMIHGSVLEAQLKFDPFFFLSSSFSDYLEFQSEIFLLEQPSKFISFSTRRFILRVCRIAVNGLGSFRQNAPILLQLSFGLCLAEPLVPLKQP
jgi:hypothetical protein